MAQAGTLHQQNEKVWNNTKEDLERSRQKIQAALKEAKERARKNTNLEDDIDTKFSQLQSLGIKLMEVLREGGLDHRADWIHLTERLCQLLIPLQGATPFMSSSEEREIRHNGLRDRQKHMMELTRLIGRKLLFEGRHHQAVPAGIQSLKFSIDVHGLNSVNLVPSYLILAEANIGLGKLTQADEYLAQAEWTVLKSPDSQDAIKSKLYRNIGLLHAAKGDYENALRMLSEDIFHACKEWGSADIKVSGGYFHMANVFFRQNKMEVADSLYTRVSEMWQSFLMSCVEKLRNLMPETDGIGPLSKQDQHVEKFFDEAQEAEAIQMLSAVFDIREQSPKPNYDAVLRICHTLSMLYFVLADLQRAAEYAQKAQSLLEVASPLAKKDFEDYLSLLSKNSS